MQLPFKVDSGAAVSLISLDSYKAVFKAVELQDTSASLYTYTAESIQVIGAMQVQVKYGDYAGEQNLFVIKGGKASCNLMGCDWL